MMFTIDRFEGKFAIVETESGEMLDVPAALLKGLKAGDVFSIKLEHGEMETRKARIDSMFEQLKKKNN